MHEIKRFDFKRSFGKTTPIRPKKYTIYYFKGLPYSGIYLEFRSIEVRCRCKPTVVTLLAIPFECDAAVLSDCRQTGRSVLGFVSWLLIAAVATSVSAARVIQLHRCAMRTAAAAHVDRVLRYRRSHRRTPCTRIRFKDAA
jgi:hypothetical protein